MITDVINQLPFHIFTDVRRKRKLKSFLQTLETEIHLRFRQFVQVKAEPVD